MNLVFKREKQLKSGRIKYKRPVPISVPTKITIKPGAETIQLKIQTELINPDEYVIVKYWGEKDLFGWVVCKNKNEELSPAFDSKDIAYEWLQNYEQQQALEKHFIKSIIVPDYFV